MSEEDAKRIECAFAPGEGACGGMYTANTMASVAEALGMSLPGSASAARGRPPPRLLRPPLGRGRRQPAAPRHHRPRHPDQEGVRERHRRRAWRSAARPTSCCTCSRSPTRPRSSSRIDDFNRIGDKVPHIGDLKPFGKYVMNDVDRHGGVPVLMKALLDAGLLHGDCLTVTGKTMAENLAEIDIPPARRRGAAHPRQPDPRDRRPHDPQGLARSRGRGRQDRRLRRRRLRGPGPRVRARARRDGRAHRGRDQRTATSSSSATRARRAARACARCSRSPPPSRAQASARMYYY